mgnify:CR=1 FL=1
MKSNSKLLSAPYTVWMTVFIILPMLLVAYFAFTDKSGSFTLENIMSVGQYSNVFLRSIWLGAVATAVSLGLGYPLAYIIAKMDVKRQNVMVMLVMLPMWMNLCLDDAAGGQRTDQCGPDGHGTAQGAYDQHFRGGGLRDGLQLYPLYDTAPVFGADQD